MTYRVMKASALVAFFVASSDTGAAFTPSMHTSEFCAGSLLSNPARKTIHLSALAPGTKEQQDNGEKPEEEENFFQKTVRQLAELSLKDYKWRSDVFKENEADRLLEQSMARVRGEEPGYVRPMDAADTSLGPLGRWEKSAVEWLSQVIDEEGRRAEKIVSGDGKLVRPKDVSDEEIGPLGFLEKTVTDFLQSIRTAEKERVKTGTLRPKDVDGAVRGPLGEAELQAMQILKEIQESEQLRMKQSELRGGEIVRPIDVPGPLGEFELSVLELFDAEQKRATQRREGKVSVVRPKDAKFKGPLGEAEEQAFETIKQLSQEERKRLDSITRILREKRPMDSNRDSFLGIAETFLVGVVRAPVMLMSVIGRVKELLSSESLAESDKEILEMKTKKPSSPDRADKGGSR